MDERQLEDNNTKLRAALLRIVHYPVPRITASTPPSVATSMVRDAMIQMQTIARDALK
jgi:hypothetical protein